MSTEWAVEVRRKRRGTEREQIAGQEQGKKVHFREEEQAEEMPAQSTDKQDVMSDLEEVRTDRGSAGLVRGGDERPRDGRDQQKRQRKGQRRKRGNTEVKGGFESRGAAQDVRQHEEDGSK